MIVLDDLGAPVEISAPARRVVSLVPSLTESVASVSRESLVGVTDWCTHPGDLDVTRIRGTKNPDVAAIVALQPDLVLANKEENRRTDVEKLRAAGIAVWVTDIETVPAAMASLERLFDLALQWTRPEWLAEAQQEWAGNHAGEGVPAVIPIWRDPWMVVGSSTFTGDLAARLGLRNTFGDSPERYPHTTVEQILLGRPELIVLPDEPYVFSADDGPECFAEVRIALVEGRLLTWYGPSLATARETLQAQLFS
jgi:ABC-type Fe3+-hydroxamate transport system substrate-binding protein